MSDTPVTDSRAFAILSDLQSGTRQVVDADVSRAFERKATSLAAFLRGAAKTASEKGMTEFAKTVMDFLDAVNAEGTADEQARRNAQANRALGESDSPTKELR